MLSSEGRQRLRWVGVQCRGGSEIRALERVGGHAFPVGHSHPVP